MKPPSGTAAAAGAATVNIASAASAALTLRGPIWRDHLWRSALPSRRCPRAYTFQQVADDARRRAPSHGRPPLVAVGLEPPPPPHEPLQRVPRDQVLEGELEHLRHLGLVRDPREAVLDQPD